MNYPKPGYYLAVSIRKEFETMGVYRVPSRHSKNWYIRWIHCGPVFSLLQGKRVLNYEGSHPKHWYARTMIAYYTSTPITRAKAKLLIKLSDQPEFRRV